MYEFDEDQWDQPEASADEMSGIMEGWLIESTLDFRSPTPLSQPRYLQIGTGQWCSAEFATLFPLHRTAVVYAKEFGYRVGENVQIVRHRF